MAGPGEAGLGPLVYYIFDFGDLRSGPFRDHYKEMGEKLNPSYNHQIRSLYHQLTYIRLLLMIQVKFVVGEPQRSHLRSTEVTNRFLLIAYD